MRPGSPLPAAALLALLAGAGCASAPAAREEDGLFLAGDYAAAAAGYAARLAAEEGTAERDLLLWRAAVALALSAPEAGGAARAEGWLRELVARFPASPHRPAAELVLRLLLEISRAREEAARERARAEDLAARAAALRLQVESASGEIASAGGELRGLEQALADLQLLLAGLRQEAAARDEQIDRLKEEIEKLKEIDLGRPPPE